MASDPICGMYVDEATAELKAEVSGVTYLLLQRILHARVPRPGEGAPEAQDRGPRLGSRSPSRYCSYRTSLPSQRRSSDYVLFALDTPIQFIVGWRFYRGVYDSLKSRMGNMDVLIALGTSAAWAYSTVVTFAPSLFPSSGVYFDTSAVIITLILTGRYLEHVTKSRASAAVRKLVELQPARGPQDRPRRRRIESQSNRSKSETCWSSDPARRFPSTR